MIARPDDEAELLSYFDASPDDTIWLRAHWADRTARFAVRRRDGQIVAVGARDVHNAIHVHAAEELPEVARECARADAPVFALCGPPEQVEAARTALDLTGRPILRLSREIIMALDLDDLVVPELLSQPGVVSRRASPDDLPLLLEWRRSYFREVHAIPADDDAIAELDADHAGGRLWVLEVDGAIVNTACFSAVFPRLVQIEYAYSPRELRAKKYGRSAVAGALLVARGEGIRRAVFNTDENNVAVQTGIQPIGFRKTQDYWVMVFGQSS